MGCYLQSSLFEQRWFSMHQMVEGACKSVVQLAGEFLDDAVCVCVGGGGGGGLLRIL